VQAQERPVEGAPVVDARQAVEAALVLDLMQLFGERRDLQVELEELAAYPRAPLVQQGR
jgi:hypothetical protein